MAISTTYFQEWGVSEIEARRGAEWWKQAIDKAVCVKIFNTCPFGDTQWLSWSKLQALLREAKRDIREELNPKLAEDRAVRERVRAEKSKEKEIEEELENARTFRHKYDDVIAYQELFNIRKGGKIICSTTEIHACFFCEKDIPLGSRCLGINEGSYYGYLYLCKDCIKKDQENGGYKPEWLVKEDEEILIERRLEKFNAQHGITKTKTEKEVIGRW